jgi:hypothetical protein
MGRGTAMTYTAKHPARAAPAHDNNAPVNVQAFDVDEAMRLLREARAALQKTMGAWMGTCAWHKDVASAITGIDAYLEGKR